MKLEVPIEVWDDRAEWERLFKPAEDPPTPSATDEMTAALERGETARLC